MLVNAGDRNLNHQNVKRRKIFNLVIRHFMYKLYDKRQKVSNVKSQGHIRIFFVRPTLRQNHDVASNVENPIAFQSRIIHIKY